MRLTHLSSGGGSCREGNRAPTTRSFLCLSSQTTSLQTRRDSNPAARIAVGYLTFLPLRIMSTSRSKMHFAVGGASFSNNLSSGCRASGHVIRPTCDRTWSASCVREEAPCPLAFRTVKRSDGISGGTDRSLPLQIKPAPRMRRQLITQKHSRAVAGSEPSYTLTGSLRATRVKAKPSGATSTVITSPSLNSPCKIPNAIGSSNSRWITRFKGRAPYSGS